MTCACPVCQRRFVVVGAASVTASRCVCGAALVAAELDEGVYEIRQPRRPKRRKPARSPDNVASPTTLTEPDQGYGASHGYGPAHGGPTGPGDAPAPEITSSTEETADTEVHDPVGTGAAIDK